jgi:LPS sulfotransferase NodH
MKDRVFKTGLTGHMGYAKFIILGRSRVGSNLLRGLLNSHRNIAAFGEIFKDCNLLDWDHLGYFQSSGMLARLQDDPVRFLDKMVFGRYPRSTTAVGFKLFYYHAQVAQYASVWPYLRQRVDVKIFHLRRKNILLTHLSRKRAALTESWVNTNGTQNDAQPIELDYNDCLDDFIRTRSWEEEFDRFFAGHSKLEVLYEDLSSNYQDEMKRVQEFLGVELKTVHPTTFKQTDQPLRETIANYFQIKEKFAGTPWEQFFVD